MADKPTSNISQFRKSVERATEWNCSEMLSTTLHEIRENPEMNDKGIVITLSTGPDENGEPFYEYRWNRCGMLTSETIALLDIVKHDMLKSF